MTSHRKEKLATIPLPREGFAQGTVEHCTAQECRVHVDACDGGDRIDTVAAVPGYAPAPGDRVLLARRDTGCGWIIGVLPGTAAPAVQATHDVAVAEPAADTLTSANGFTASLRREEQSERLEVRDAQDRLLYQLEPETGKAMIYAPGGDLTLASATGYVDLVAARSVRCLARESVVLRAGSTAEEAASSSLRLTQDEAGLTGQRISVTGEDANVQLKRTRFIGDCIQASVERLRTTAGRVEHIVDRLVERIKTVHRSVEGLSALKAGRVRTRVEGAHEVHAGHASITCEEELKLDGKRIHLG